MSQSTAPAKEVLSRRAKWLLACSAAGLAGAYFTYRIYTSDSLAALTELRKRARKILDGYSTSLLLASDCTTTVLQDLKDFLESDEDDIPQSLKQLCKLAQSQEVADASTRMAASAMLGAVRGLRGEPDGSEHPLHDTLDRVVDALTTDRGKSLVSLAVSMACRSSVHAVAELSGSGGSPGQPWWHQLLEFGATAKGEKLYATLVSVFVREGMQVYTGSLEGTSAWEDFLAALCKPERQAALDRMTRVSINELVVSYLKRQRHSFRGSESKAGRAKHSLLAASTRDSSSHALLAEVPAEALGRKEAAKREGGAETATADDSAAASSAALSACVSVLAEAASKPELRGLLVAVTGTAAFEAVRSTMLTAGELFIGGSGLSGRHLSKGSSTAQGLVTRHLGALLLFLFLPVIVFLVGRRAVLA